MVFASSANLHLFHCLVLIIHTRLLEDLFYLLKLVGPRKSHIKMGIMRDLRSDCLMATGHQELSFSGYRGEAPATQGNFWGRAGWFTSFVYQGYYSSNLPFHIFHMFGILATCNL